MLKQYHSQKLHRNTVEISWDLFNICNYDCSYCYMKGKPDDWLKFGNYDQQVEYAKKISAMPDVSVNIVGGEPSLFPKLKDFTSYFSDLIITTNLSRIPDVHKQENINLNISYHVDQADDEDFKANIDKILSMNFKSIIVTIIMHHSKVHWDRVENMSKYLYFLGVSIEPTYLTHGYNFFKYPKGFKDFRSKISKYFKAEEFYIFDEKSYSEFDLFDAITENSTRFKGYDCYINRYIININGLISKSCVGEEISIDDLVNIDKIEPFTCNQETCTLNCHLSFTKYEKEITTIQL